MIPDHRRICTITASAIISAAGRRVKTPGPDDGIVEGNGGDLAVLEHSGALP